ncbi:MAG: 4'-phosphopantetheinyl transferase superfamily protein [Ruminococcaceae bacterium]|nr:4'-phosphopantetheinyl transferase superfamily protein [Oscillospiraceae bacterium]
MLYVCGSEYSGKDASTAVRKLLAAAFLRLTGEAMPEIKTLPAGKPYWEDGNLHFSLCHTRQAVFCAISDGIVGLDAEKIRPVSPAVVSRVLSPEELRQFDGSDEGFMRLWTLKEAYVKYTGEGLHGYPNKLSFDGTRLMGSELFFASLRHRDWMVSICSEKAQTLSVFWDELKE